jgi:hypothetical protein
LAAASSASAGAVIEADTATSAAALAIIKTRVLVKGPLLLAKCRMYVPPLPNKLTRPGLIPDLLFSWNQTLRKITTAKASEITVASHRLDKSIPPPIGSVAMVSVPTSPIHSR